MPFKDNLKKLDYGRKYQAKQREKLKGVKEVESVKEQAVKYLYEHCVARRFSPFMALPNDYKEYYDLGGFRLSSIPIVSKHIESPITRQSIESSLLKIVEEEDKLLLVGEHKDWPCLGLEGLATAKHRIILKSCHNFGEDVKRACQRLHHYNQNPDYAVIASSGVKLPYPLAKTPNYYESKMLCDKQGNHTNMLIVKPHVKNFRILVGSDFSVYRKPDGGYILWEALVMNVPNPKAICEIQGV